MDAAGEWHALLRPDEELSPAFCRRFGDEMRARKLTFGERLHSPFLRPFFLTDRDEARIRAASEAIAAAGERVARAALESPELMRQLGMTDPEIRLVELDPGYATASTASRLDAFLLPESVHFAEYNAESPAGLGYTQRLCELFDTLPAMGRFREAHRVRHYQTIDAMLGALVASYAEWGGGANPPVVAIVDWREVPTWSEFEILADAFGAAGVPTIVADPRDLAFDGGVLRAGGRQIDLVYRRVLINDIVSRSEECRALVEAYAAHAVCVANTFRCKLAHKKAFFAVLTDPAHAGLFRRTELDVIHASIPWTRVVEDTRTRKDGRDAGLRARLGDDGGGVGRNAQRGAGRSGRHVDPAGAHSRASRNVSAVRRRRERDDARHARGFRAVPVSWTDGRLPDAPERDRTRQRHIGRWSGAGVRGRRVVRLKADATDVHGPPEVGHHRCVRST
jgi:hypothetical protein